VLVTGQIPGYVFVDLTFGVVIQGPEFAFFHKNPGCGGNLNSLYHPGEDLFCGYNLLKQKKINGWRRRYQLSAVSFQPDFPRQQNNAKGWPES
jgi:hypothetical protein